MSALYSCPSVNRCEEQNDRLWSIVDADTKAVITARDVAKVSVTEIIIDLRTELTRTV